MGIIRNLLNFVVSPTGFVFNLIFEHPVAVVSTLFFGVLLIKLFYKWLHTPYTGNEDMNGKTVLITGATIGTGKAAAFDLAKRNARVLLACRNVEKGRRVADEIKSATGNQNVIVEYLDLCSFESVRQCARRVLEKEDKLHVLINNACILDLLKRSSPSRIINVTSGVQASAEFDVEDLNNDKGLDLMTVFYNSKLANTLFTKALSRRILRTGVTVNCVYPGFVPTEFIELTTAIKIMLFIMGKTYEEAAETIIRLAVDPCLEKTTGKYFHNCVEIPTLLKDAENVQLGERLFELSARAVGVSL